MTLVQLGKFGDIINVLPLAFMLQKKLGGRIRWLVGKDWASILEGASYVEPIIFNGRDDELKRAIYEYRGHHKLVTQAWQNPDNGRQTDSFAKEQWRYAGSLNELGKWPLVFDQRDKEREQVLISRMAPINSKPIVLVSTRSVSTPYPHAFKLLDTLKKELDADVIDISSDCATRIYDMLGLYDVADLLITVDTCHPHLARASYCPVIMLQNDGWRGSPPPPQTVASWRYSELGNDLSQVVDAAKKQLSRKVESIALVCHTYSKGHDDRHKRAMATHPQDTIYAEHDHRPTMKELFGHGLNAHKDVVAFTNDDVTFPSGALEKIRKHAQKFDFGCSRRPRNPVHIGREIFWFRSDWLREHWEQMPNPYWSVQKPDLILARWLRHLRGIPTTLENLHYDFPPVDVPDLIIHEDHRSHWAVLEIEQSNEGLYNESLWSAGV
jgi:hypothetical protein